LKQIPVIAKQPVHGHDCCMKPNQHIGRNDPCTCGSGRKYKNCCQRKIPQSTLRSPAAYVVLGVAGVVLALAAGKVVFWPAEKAPQSTSTLLPMPWPQAPTTGARSGNLTPQPPGPIPEGKVWSPEHGHWHDATAAAAGSTPQPPGPVPEGKVWSTEHGHWHDAPASAQSAPVQPL
jgi:SEC-C motif